MFAQILRAAIRWEWINKNVAGLVPNPTHKVAEVGWFEDWGAVYSFAEHLGALDRMVRPS